MIKDNQVFLSPENVTFSGDMDTRVRKLISGLYLKVDFYLLADYFRNKLDEFAAGEFWGKMMRSACVVWQYTHDDKLKKVLDDAFEDILSIQGPDGEISSAPKDLQPKGKYGSDLWERKYLLLGLWAYWEATRDDRAFECMCKLADYTISQVGNEPKTPITETGWEFFGIESSSILEPIMRLYHVTKKQHYLDFAKYIVEETGACKRESIFEAIENGTLPKDVGSNGIPEESICKAYEMMSCYEGLVEYARATQNERWEKLAVKFADALLDNEITYLGSGGADGPYNLGAGPGEQWNNTRFEQNNPDLDLMQETCVTITWMKFCLQLFRLTGQTKWMDQIECSMYNALWGAMHPVGGNFDYFPKFNGKRGGTVNFACTVGGFELSCCTANGPMGLAACIGSAVAKTQDGISVNLFFPGKYIIDENTTLEIDTKYPTDGHVSLKVTTKHPEEFTLQVRMPNWCDNAGWKTFKQTWEGQTEVSVDVPMKVQVYEAPKGSNPAGHPFFLVKRGPLVMARDKRFDSDYDKASDIVSPEDAQDIDCADAMAAIKIGDMTFIDYASAGITWDDTSAYATWIKRSDA